MGYIKEKVAYIKGLAEGMELEKDTKTGKLIVAMIDVMGEMADSIDEHECAIMEIDECVDDIYDELDELDECCFDDGDFEDDFVEIECPHCGETVYFDRDMLEDDELICPNCNETIVPSLDEE